MFRLQQQLEAAEQNIKELQQLISSKDRLIQELQFALKNKTNDYSDLQTNLQELKEKHEKTLKQIPTFEEIQTKQKEKEKIIEQLESFKAKLDESEKREKELKMLAERLKMDLSQRPSIKDVEELKESIAKIEADNKNLRFKAGQIFLDGLDHDEENDPGPAESHLQDDEILQRLENALRGNPPSFKQRLTDADSNKDGKVMKGELVKLLGSLSLPPQDVIVLTRIAGFRKGVPSVSIESLVNLIAQRGQRKENLENLLFSKLSSIFENHSLSIEQAFEYLDVNKDGFISFQELTSACEYLKLNLSREDRHALFAVLDSDHNGTISLQELKEKIEKAPEIPKPLALPADKPANRRYSEAKEPTPASSERNSEVPTIEKKSLGKTIPEAEKNNPVKDQKNTSKKVNGSLVIGVVRGKDLGPGFYSVEARIEGAEKSAKTPQVAGPNPN